MEVLRAKCMGRPSAAIQSTSSPPLAPAGILLCFDDCNGDGRLKAAAVLIAIRRKRKKAKVPSPSSSSGTHNFIVDFAALGLGFMRVELRLFLAAYS